MVFFCLLFSSPAFAGIFFRQASIEDRELILQLYNNYSEEDLNYLVTFPGEVASDFLKMDLEHKKLFVAVNDDTQAIVSVVKLFIIKESDISQILNNELRCIGPERKPVLIENFDSNLVDNRKKFFMNNFVSSSSDDAGFELNVNRQSFIYYGGAYTVPEQRGAGIQTQLLQNALEAIQPDLISDLQAFPLKRQLVFVYGQVQANSNSKGMIHVFTSFVKNIVSASDLPIELKERLTLSPQVTHQTYLSYKPLFTFNPSNQSLEVSFPEKNIGVGNLVIVSIKRK
jgi:hypothetical protein